MTFECTCPHCDTVSHVNLSQAGQQITCGGCGERLTVPAPSETSGETEAVPTVLRFACPSCGRKYATKPEMAGKKIRCTGCGAGVRVPGVPIGKEMAQARASRPAMKTFGANEGPPRPARDRGSATGADPSSLLDELAAIEGVKTPRHAGSVLPKRSEVMEQVRQEVAEKEAVKAEKAKVKKKKRKGSSFFDPKETLNLVGGVGAFVAVLALLSWAYPDLRFPIGGGLCVIGFIVYLLGAASIRQLVAEEGVHKVILFRFFPPYQWYYVATNWADTKDFVAFFVAGLVILSIGTAVIKSSPVGKKAEESERAYQKARAGDQGESPPPVAKGVIEDGN